MCCRQNYHIFKSSTLVKAFIMENWLIHTQICWRVFYRNSGSYRINMSTTHEYNCLIQHLFDRIHILIGETGLLLLYGLIHSVWYTLWWELNRFDFNFKPYSTSRYLYFTGTNLIRPLNCTVVFDTCLMIHSKFSFTKISISSLLLLLAIQILFHIWFGLKF